MKRLIFFALTAISLLSCDMLNKPSPDKSHPVEFRANVGQYVKATDTAFEDGDAVSIAALAPINSGNVKYTVKGGVLTSDNPIYWNKDQKDSTIFLLLYPYNASVKELTDSSAYEFSVSADQSTHAKYTMSDLMTGQVAATPDDEYVSFSVNHQLSQLVVKIDNRSGKTVSGVTLSSVYTTVKCSAEGVSPVGVKGTVRACPVELDGTPSWVLVIAPQTVKSDLIITTSDGQQITYTMQEGIDLRPGYRSTATAVIEKGPQIVGFTATVNDWNSGRDFNFVFVSETDVK